MAASSFVHLHVHSEYSLLDGACRTSELAERAKELGMPAVALSDHGNLFGAIEFYQACQKAQVKPILGCEVYLAPGDRREKKGSIRESNTHLLLLAKDLGGYKNLLKLVSMAHLEGFHYKPRVDKEILAQYAKGLICTSACLKGEVAQAILHKTPKDVEKSIDDFRNIFAPGDFYLEIANHGISEQQVVNREIIKYAKAFNLPLVATNDVHYLKKEHNEAHDILLCIQTGSLQADEKRMRYPSQEYYFKTPEEMAELFSDVPEALENTLAIAEKCDVKFELGVNRYPSYDPPVEFTREGYLRHLCFEGLAWRYGERAKTTELIDRLNYELSVLEKTGFVSYFLITWDFINYARQSGIPVGPGRGSAAGSMIAYVLGITDLCPIEYGLFFERFLNPERVSPPDIDIDFCYNRRVEVIEYVRKKYGDASVAQIITFGTLGAKMAVRDVARVLGLSYGEADRLAKMIPFDPKMTLEKALADNPEFKQAYDEEEITHRVVDYALTLEGIARQAGVHAAGVVIAEGDLTDTLPLTRDDNGGVVTQFSMESLGEVGVLKMDFLGLKTLTVIDDCLKLMKQSQGVELTQAEIPLKDPKTYQLLSRAQNTGVFQVESPGMRDLCKKLKPENIEDIIALVALFRPGPMENIPAYAERKLGTVEIEYDHPLLEPILKDTYGVMIYQEQVMQAASVLAGYSLGQADLLRRAMGKKKLEEMNKQRAMFVKGCGEINNIAPKRASEIFDVLEKFAGYGFNKAHSACYGVLAYQTAWLKANYPVEFLAALMSNELDSTEKISLFVAEAKAMGIEVMPPSVNESAASFSVHGKTIRFGMAAIKNVGSAVVDMIIKGRQTKGPFTSLNDLCHRVEAKALNKKTLESLIKAGACDCFQTPRPELISQIDMCVGGATTAARDRDAGQIALFDVMSLSDSAPAATSRSIPIADWPLEERLRYEKELLGFYISGHPLDTYASELKALQLAQVGELKQMDPNSTTRLVGLVTKVDVRLTMKDKKPWARLTFEDHTGVTEVLLFPDVYANLTKAIQQGDVVAVVGEVDRRDEDPKLRAREVMSLDDARMKLYQQVTLHIPLETWDSQRWHALQDLVLDHPGRVGLNFLCRRDTGETLDVEVGERYRVDVNEKLLSKLGDMFGRGGYELAASTALPKPAKRKWAPRNSED